LINDLFELSRIENAVEQVSRQEVDIGAAIEDIVKLILKKPENADHRIHFVKPSQPVVILTEHNSIVQIMINLLDNAVKFSDPKEDIRIVLEERPEEIIVSVIDKGEGIPEKEQRRVFERFYRVDQARSRKTGGTGLGLSIVKHLAERLGGRAGVESKPGEGSRFIFQFPGNLEITAGYF
jgi:two-component system phosphate regulon sensor histidine kinase PhoR